MGRGDKKSTKGKRTIGSFGNTRSRKKIKSRLKRVAGASKASAEVPESKPKTRKVVKKKELTE